ncbi:hypothetical protein [Tateyamaria sp. SN6-1]|uniref:hypothetical protein n=1 Tax=Tateyamaria sp. SN6-1 TaxID=3092148 RepID=UPI0039F44C87
MMARANDNTYPRIDTEAALRDAIYAYHDWAAAELGHPLATLNGIYQITAQMLEAMADGTPLRDVIHRTQVVPAIDQIEAGMAHVDDELGIALRQMAQALRTDWGNLMRNERFVVCTLHAAQMFRHGPVDGTPEYRDCYGTVMHVFAEPLLPRAILLHQMAQGGRQPGHPDPRNDWFARIDRSKPSYFLETSLLQQIVSFGRYYAQNLAFGRGRDIAERIQDYILDPAFQGQMSNLHPASGPVELAPEDILWAASASGQEALARAATDQLDALPARYWDNG